MTSGWLSSSRVVMVTVPCPAQATLPLQVIVFSMTLFSERRRVNVPTTLPPRSSARHGKLYSRRRTCTSTSTVVVTPPLVPHKRARMVPLHSAPRVPPLGDGSGGGGVWVVGGGGGGTATTVPRMISATSSRSSSPASVSTSPRLRLT